MNQEQELQEALNLLKEGEFLFFDDRRCLGHWDKTITDMEKRGLIKTQFVEGDQYSQLRLYKGEGS